MPTQGICAWRMTAGGRTRGGGKNERTSVYSNLPSSSQLMRILIFPVEEENLVFDFDGLIRRCKDEIKAKRTKNSPDKQGPSPSNPLLTPSLCLSLFFLCLSVSFTLALSLSRSLCFPACIRYCISASLPPSTLTFCLPPSLPPSLPHLSLSLCLPHCITFYICLPSFVLAFSLSPSFRSLPASSNSPIQSHRKNQSINTCVRSVSLRPISSDR